MQELTSCFEVPDKGTHLCVTLCCITQWLHAWQSLGSNTALLVHAAAISSPHHGQPPSGQGLATKLLCVESKDAVAQASNCIEELVKQQHSRAATSASNTTQRQQAAQAAILIITACNLRAPGVSDTVPCSHARQ